MSSMVIEGACGAVASRKSQVASLKESVSKKRNPKLFTIHYSLFTKKQRNPKPSSILHLPSSISKSSNGGF